MPAKSGGGRLSIIQACAFDDTALSLSGLRMLGVLGTYSNEEGWCWPSQEHLAERLGIPQQNVSRSINEIRKLGYIEIHHEPVRNGGYRKRAKYRLLLDFVLPAERRRTTTTEAERTPPQVYGGDTHTSPGVRAHTSRGVPTNTPRGVPPHTSPGVENVPSLTTKKNDPEKNEEDAITSPPAAGDVAFDPGSKRKKTEPPPSKDGRSPADWERGLVEHCYAGVALPEWGQQVRSLSHLRQHYPLEVVLKYYDFRQAHMRERRTLTPKVLATDISSWLELDTAMQEWERQHGQDAGTATGLPIIGRAGWRGGAGDPAAPGREDPAIRAEINAAVARLNHPIVRPDYVGGRFSRLRHVQGRGLPATGD